MSKVRVHISTSLDGYVAGPNQSQKEPLGEGGESLHDWLVELKAWREAQGMDGGEENVGAAVVQEEYANVGAEIMGRGKFGPATRGPGATIHGGAGGVTTRHSTSRSSSSPTTSGSR